VTWQLVLSCEHATHDVPKSFRGLFRGQAAVLRSHRGWDPGTLDLGRALEQQFNAPLLVTTVSRLLVEVNRSEHHPRLFSEFSRHLPDDKKRQLLQEYYWPHRQAVAAAVRQRLAGQTRVLHLSLHSFIGTWDGVSRAADIGLLYDPRRHREQAFCREWQQRLRTALPGRIIRRNYPYLGRADGLTTALRRQFSERYLGIELEINQDHMQSHSAVRRQIQAAVMESLANLLKDG
jgi:predicted N-formylglutamate amidohydrolase